MSIGEGEGTGGIKRPLDNGLSSGGTGRSFLNERGAVSGSAPPPARIQQPDVEQTPPSGSLSSRVRSGVPEEKDARAAANREKWRLRQANRGNGSGGTGGNGGF